MNRREGAFRNRTAIRFQKGKEGTHAQGHFLRAGDFSIFKLLEMSFWEKTSGRLGLGMGYNGLKEAQ